MQWYVSFSRYVQILAVFHPECRTSQERDSVISYRIHNDSMKLLIFIPGREMSSCKGSIPSKSNFNPIRQYNNSKPDNYRFDIFVLVLTNVLGGHDFIYHINIYQWKMKAIFQFFLIFDISQKCRKQLWMQLFLLDLIEIQMNSENYIWTIDILFLSCFWCWRCYTRSLLVEPFYVNRKGWD